MAVIMMKNFIPSNWDLDDDDDRENSIRWMLGY